MSFLRIRLSEASMLRPLRRHVQQWDAYRQYIRNEAHEI